MASAKQFLGNGTATNKLVAKEFKNGSKQKIVAVEVKETPGSKEPCIAVQFKGSQLWVRVNATSIRKLTPKLGDETDDWIGKDVMITLTQQSVKGNDATVLLLAPS